MLPNLISNCRCNDNFQLISVIHNRRKQKLWNQKRTEWLKGRLHWPSLFIPICRHFLRRHAWHWLRCDLSTVHIPVPAWHLSTNTRDIIYRLLTYLRANTGWQYIYNSRLKLHFKAKEYDGTKHLHEYRGQCCFLVTLFNGEMLRLAGFLPRDAL